MFSLVVLDVPAKAANTADRVFGMRGKVGNYPVAMILTIRAYTQIVKAHYSYASAGRQIPLATEMVGDQIALAEAGGGVFHLHFITNEITQ